MATTTTTTSTTKPKKTFSYPDRDDFKTGYEASLTTQQFNALEEFKTQLKTTQYWTELEANPDGDRFLLRFLRATMKDKNGSRLFQVKPAIERITTTMEFRRQHHADDIRAAIERGEPVSKEFARYRDEVRPRLQFIDRRSGRLVHIERFGCLGSALNVQHFEHEKWIEFFVWECERTLHILREESKTRGYEVSTQISVIDQAHSGIGVLKRMSLFKVMNAVAERNYPELLGPVFLVNCPWLFSSIFNMIKGLIDPDTASKLIVESDIPKDMLASFLSVEDLPKEFGGNNDVIVGRCCDFKD